MAEQYQQQIEQIRAAADSGQALNIVGSDSKAFYGEAATGSVLYTNQNRGIVDYDPAELVMVACAGTPLSEIQATLAEQGQMLGFEPPFIKQGASLGGAVASGLSGSARPYRGGVRDYLLGAKLLNGEAQVLQFGGRVMKNVAGFDLFRPMAGAMGTLGLLLELSLRVIPLPETELTLSIEQASRAGAISKLCGFGQSLSCLSAAAWLDGKMLLRLSGSELAVNRDRGLLEQQYEIAALEANIWLLISAFEHEFFMPDDATRLVSIDLPAATEDIILPGEQLLDWGGARRYLKTPLALENVRAAVHPLGGSVNLLHREQGKTYFQALSPPLMAIHQRIKASFDPKGIFNPGRLYPNL